MGIAAEALIAGTILSLGVVSSKSTTSPVLRSTAYRAIARSNFLPSITEWSIYSRPSTFTKLDLQIPSTGPRKFQLPHRSVTGWLNHMSYSLSTAAFS